MAKMDRMGLDVRKNVISDQMTNNEIKPSVIPNRRSAHGRIKQNVIHSKHSHSLKVRISLEYLPNFE